MSFFSKEIQQERARIVEAMQQDAERLLSIRQQVAEDIAERARLAYLASGSVAEVEGKASIEGAVRTPLDAGEYQETLREIEKSVAEAFEDSGSEVTVRCWLSSYQITTDRWINYDAMEMQPMTAVNAHATFEPPLT